MTDGQNPSLLLIIDYLDLFVICFLAFPVMLRPKPSTGDTSMTRTRRQFLKTSAATITAPLFVRNLLSQPPSRRVRHACVGADGMGGADMGSLSSHKDVHILCV